MIVYGAGMGNSNAHDPLDLPIVLAGGGGGAIKGGRHVRLPEGTPLANMHLTVLEKMGIRPSVSATARASSRSVRCVAGRAARAARSRGRLRGLPQ